MPKPSDIARARGYGKLAELHRAQAMANHPTWKDVPGFPEYEVNELRQIRRVTTKAISHPYAYKLRPGEGEFVDFWISGQRHAISMESIMAATFPKGGTQ